MMTTCKFFLSFLLLLFCAHASALESDPRLKTFVYSEGEIFRVDTSCGFQSFIQFSDKELIKTIALGNSIGWSINPVGEKIFLRPLETGLSTNMVVVTDRRTYVFDLFSLPEGAEKVEGSHGVRYVVRFLYPDEISSDGQAGVDEVFVDSGSCELDCNSLWRNYSFSGKVDFKLIEVMNNLDLTFFKFEGPAIPRVFIVNPDRSETKAKMWRFKEYMVIEGVHKRMYLRYQDSVLEVVNNDLE